MKKSDIAMIILIASVSMLIAYFIAKGVLGDVQSQSVKVKIAEKIENDVTDPDAKIFHSTAINPTVEAIIGGDAAATQSQ